MSLKYTIIQVIIVFLTLFLLFLVRSFPPLNLKYIGRNCLLGNGKKIAKFLMRTFTCRSTFLYGSVASGFFLETHSAGFIKEKNCLIFTVMDILEASHLRIS